MPPASSTRPAHAAEFDGQALVARVGKGKQVDAIVEAAMSGSNLRVTLLPDLQSAMLNVAGVLCPSMGRRPAAAAAAPAAAAGGEGEGGAPAGPAPGSAASLEAAGTPAAAEAGPEPFAREARYFTEVRTLNKEVKITLYGVNQVRGWPAGCWVLPAGCCQLWAAQLLGAGAAAPGRTPSPATHLPHPLPQCSLAGLWAACSSRRRRARPRRPRAPTAPPRRPPTTTWPRPWSRRAWRARLSGAST